MPRSSGERSLELTRVVRWDRPEPADEATLRAIFAAEGLQPYRWSNDAFVSYGEHRHPYVKVLYVVRGSISFTLTDLNRTIDLQAGDRLELAASTNHTAMVGPEGVVCLEAPRQSR